MRARCTRQDVPLEVGLALKMRLREQLGERARIDT